MEKYDYYIDQLIEEVVEKDVGIVGLTVYEITKWFAIEVALRLRVRKPSIKIIAGGPSCFRREFARSLVEGGIVDVVCVGEGEAVLVGLLDSMEENKGRIGFCPGSIYREKDGKIVDCGRQDAIANLDSLPFADFSDFDLRLYDSRGVSISTSRGCINRCIFCEEAMLWGKFRSRSAAHIYAEIVYQLKKYPYLEYFHFADSLINGDTRMLDELAELIINGNVKFSWAGQMAIRKEMNLDLMRKLRKAGLGFVSCGLESASPKNLRLMRKSFSPFLAEEVIRNIKKAGIGIGVNIIVGFPGEVWEDIELTLQFLKRNLDFIDDIHLHSLMLLEDSFLYKRRGDFNIVIPQDGDKVRDWYIAGQDNTLATRLEKLKFLKESLGPKTNMPEESLAN